VTIKGECYTNLDEYHREHWPTMFVAVPRVGEVVQAESGKLLRVVRVTHCVRAVKKPVPVRSFSEASTKCIEVKEPYIRVELHKLC